MEKTGSTTIVVGMLPVLRILQEKDKFSTCIYSAVDYIYVLAVNTKYSVYIRRKSRIKKGNDVIVSSIS